MTIAQNMLAEFEDELKTTRRFLEQLPADKLNWQPHEKSMTAGALALHIARAPGRVVQMAQEDAAPIPDFGKAQPQPASREEVLAALEESAATVRALLPTYSDERMQKTWRALKDGKELMAMPRVVFLRKIMLNHIYHHRGQFGVYLRLMGALVPSSYGPSGDEMPTAPR
jgi:uncharacterized damage-inducible protein DinB